MFEKSNMSIKYTNYFPTDDPIIRCNYEKPLKQIITKIYLFEWTQNQNYYFERHIPNDFDIFGYN